jgi:hypothetical protein
MALIMFCVSVCRCVLLRDTRNTEHTVVPEFVALTAVHTETVVVFLSHQSVPEEWAYLHISHSV